MHCGIKIGRIPANCLHNQPMFLACAVAAEADFLITGDSDFKQAQTLLNTTIISVSLFSKLVCD
jgi:predicted nucleic acid-binding protein